MLLFYFAAREDAFGARVERAAPSMNWMSIIEFLGGRLVRSSEFRKSRKISRRDRVSPLPPGGEQEWKRGLRRGGRNEREGQYRERDPNPFFDAPAGHAIPEFIPRPLHLAPPSDARLSLRVARWSAELL